jgi:transcriptional regulator with XRE-family HTH domain
MRTRTRDFPGTDEATSQRMALDVAEDEDAIIQSVLELRRSNPMSLEAMGFLLGTGAGQISRYLNRSAGVTITNYVRIARALGYRCRIVLEKADASQPGHQPLSDLRIEPHKVSNARPAPAAKNAADPSRKKVHPLL